MGGEAGEARGEGAGKNGGAVREGERRGRGASGRDAVGKAWGDEGGGHGERSGEAEAKRRREKSE